MSWKEHVRDTIKSATESLGDIDRATYLPEVLEIQDIDAHVQAASNAIEHIRSLLKTLRVKQGIFFNYRGQRITVRQGE